MLLQIYLTCSESKQNTIGQMRTENAMVLVVSEHNLAFVQIFLLVFQLTTRKHDRRMENFDYIVCFD